MGQYESTNRLYNSNEQLVFMLTTRECIYSPNVEKVFRSVDRGLYFTDDNKLNAYRETDWQSGDVHLFAPSHYAIVLECLDLHKGHKFLNIGSGIGYFSTLAGLLLGVNGVNHGIEIHSSLIDIAYQKLEEFKDNSAAIDYFDFCEPVFIKGNVCELSSVGYYDRVYCGAEVPPAEYSFMLALIKIGGVLVMTLKGVLVKVTREGELSWNTIQVLQESIPHLVVSEKCSSMRVLKFPTVQPLSLKELCRSNIRASIRDCLNESYPGLQIPSTCKPNIISFSQKLLNEARSGMMSLRSVVDLIWLKQADSDIDSTSENEEDNDDDTKRKPSDTKRKPSEAGCSSEQNKALHEKPENTKRMRTNISSTGNNLSDYESTNLEFWQTMLTVPPESSDDDDDDDDDDEENDHNGEDLVDGKINCDSNTVNEITEFRFLCNRKENEMSKLLKVRINLLPVPAMLKGFLNYNKDD